MADRTDIMSAVSFLELFHGLPDEMRVRVFEQGLLCRNASMHAISVGAGMYTYDFHPTIDHFMDVDRDMAIAVFMDNMFVEVTVDGASLFHPRLHVPIIPTEAGLLAHWRIDVPDIVAATIHIKVLDNDDSRSHSGAIDLTPVLVPLHMISIYISRLIALQAKVLSVEKNKLPAPGSSTGPNCEWYDVVVAVGPSTRVQTGLAVALAPLLMDPRNSMKSLEVMRHLVAAEKCRLRINDDLGSVADLPVSGASAGIHTRWLCCLEELARTSVRTLLRRGQTSVMGDNSELLYPMGAIAESAQKLLLSTCDGGGSRFPTGLKERLGRLVVMVTYNVTALSCCHDVPRTHWLTPGFPSTIPTHAHCQKSFCPCGVIEHMLGLERSTRGFPEPIPHAPFDIDSCTWFAFLHIYCMRHFLPERLDDMDDLIGLPDCIEVLTTLLIYIANNPFMSHSGIGARIKHDHSLLQQLYVHAKDRASPGELSSYIPWATDDDDDDDPRFTRFMWDRLSCGRVKEEFPLLLTQLTDGGLCIEELHDSGTQLKISDDCFS